MTKPTKARAPSDDSDQPGYPPSLIRVFAVRSMGSWGPNVSSCGLRRLWSDWADAQADLCLRWAHMPFCLLCHAAAHIMLRETQKERWSFYTVFLYWPFQGGTSVLVPYCSCCLCLYFGSSIMLVTYFVNFRYLPSKSKRIQLNT